MSESKLKPCLIKYSNFDDYAFIDARKFSYGGRTPSRCDTLDHDCVASKPSSPRNMDRREIFKMGSNGRSVSAATLNLSSVINQNQPSSRFSPNNKKSSMLSVCSLATPPSSRPSSCIGGYSSSSNLDTPQGGVGGGWNFRKSSDPRYDTKSRTQLMMMAVGNGRWNQQKLSGQYGMSSSGQQQYDGVTNGHFNGKVTNGQGEVWSTTGRGDTRTMGNDQRKVSDNGHSKSWTVNNSQRKTSRIANYRGEEELIENGNHPDAGHPFVLEMQHTIVKAKAEGKTVSLIKGDLYIDYRYVAPLPEGCRV